jgi:aldose 1-epimerase
MSSLPTGEQHHLRSEGAFGPVTATVVELAAGIRSLTVGGVDLVQDYAADSLPSWGSGIVLVPWPNRVAGARWTDDDGKTQQLDITEPSRGNAIHGLLRNTGYRVTDRSDGAITLTAPVFPQHGYPFHLDTSVRYELGEDGITVTHGIRNAGDRPAPVGIGAHPFLRVGDTPMRDLTVTVHAGTYFEVDDRQIPVAEHPVAGTEYDLTQGRPLAGARFDTPFADVELVDGLARHRLTAPGGAAVELWGSEDFRFTQVFTTSRYVSPSGVIDAVAIEPMTCAPDALNSRRGLRMLEPGEQWVTSWGIRRLPA